MRLLLLCLLLFSNLAISQIIPDSIRVDWSKAGLQNELIPINWVDVTDFGAVGDGITDDQPAIVSAINSLSGISGVVYFPPGQYRIQSSIQLPDSVILRGASSDSTHLLFHMGGTAQNGLNAYGANGSPFTSITGGFQKGSTMLQVSDPSFFNAGDHTELLQDNGPWDTNPAVWAANAVGQLVKIDSVIGNMLHVDQKLRMDYDPGLQLRIRKMIPKEYVGIECLSLERLDNVSSGVAYNIFFNNASNCWVRGVESKKSVSAHVMVSSGSHIEVSGSYFHHAFAYDGVGTRGYGVTLNDHSGHCLIENNIFRYLRHAMMVKEGANGNVFAYNYSREPNRSEFLSEYSGDISLHGHYPFANLFEGNIIQNIIIDHFWGPSGPYNTFFRNRAELYGIVMTPATVTTDLQNFVGNEITNQNGGLFGIYFLTGNGHFQYGNNWRDSIVPAGTSILPDSSYYLQGQPDFWDSSNEWPSIGVPDTSHSGTIPAKERYFSGALKTVCTPRTNCSVPEGLDVEPLSGTAVALSWVPVTEASSFIIRGKGIQQSTWTNISISCSSCSTKVINNLSPDVFYEWQIQTVCGMNETTAFSSPDTFSIEQLVNCQAPDTSWVSNVSPTAVLLGWSSQDKAYKYEIKGRKQGTSVIKSILVNATDTTKLITGLDQLTAYEWQVRSYCVPSGKIKSSFTPISSFITCNSCKWLSQSTNDERTLKMYPNPAKDQLFLQMLGSKNEKYHVELFNLERQVAEYEINSSDITKSISLNQFPPGIYFLRIKGVAIPVRKLIIY